MQKVHCTVFSSIVHHTTMYHVPCKAIVKDWVWYNVPCFVHSASYYYCTCVPYIVHSECIGYPLAHLFFIDKNLNAHAWKFIPYSLPLPLLILSLCIKPSQRYNAGFSDPHPAIPRILGRQKRGAVPKPRFEPSLYPRLA